MCSRMLDLYQTLLHGSAFHIEDLPSAVASHDVSRRTVAALIASTACALQARAAEDPPYFRAENSSVESDTEGVKKEEQIARSSTTSTEPSAPRGGGQKLQTGEVKSSSKSCPCGDPSLNSWPVFRRKCCLKGYTLLCQHCVVDSPLKEVEFL